MATVLENVDLRTRLAGHNRMELLLFRIQGHQVFGINVFKVREVVRCPPLTHVPHAHGNVRGITSLRGATIPVIDLSKAVGGPELNNIDKNAFVIVTEVNRCVYGLLVGGVDRIINLSWESIMPPPPGADASTFLTAVAKIGSDMIEILDIEHVLNDVVQFETAISEGILETGIQAEASDRFVLVVDDSVVARRQISQTLGQAGVKYVMAKNGNEAYDLLSRWKQEEPQKLHNLIMVISDIEMPEMDGYTLTTNIKRDPGLQHIYVLLHSSLSGTFNQNLVDQVQADCFLVKYCADKLAKSVLDRLQLIN